MITTAVGVLATITGIVRLWPQVIKGYKTKSTRDISIWWEYIGCSNASLWCVYGLLIKDNILTIGTFIVAISYILLIHQKHTYG